MKQCDQAREKQVSKQSKKIEACEAKFETFIKNNPSSSSSSLDPSSPSFNPTVKTPPPSSSVLQGKPLQYAMPSFPITPCPPAQSNIPSGALTDQVAAIQMSQLNLGLYQPVPVGGFAYTNSVYSTPTAASTDDKEDSLLIDGTQYCSLVGTGGKNIDSIRDKTQANITIKASIVSRGKMSQKSIS